MYLFGVHSPCFQCPTCSEKLVALITHEFLFFQYANFEIIQVANLIEIHLQALYLLANQIHLPGEEVVANPISFLQIISKHKVSYTFAPNFLLASLVRSLESEKHMSISEEWIEKKLEGFNALAVQEPDTVDVPGGTKPPLRLDLNLYVSLESPCPRLNVPLSMGGWLLS